MLAVDSTAEITETPTISTAVHQPCSPASPPRKNPIAPAATAMPLRFARSRYGPEMEVTVPHSAPMAAIAPGRRWPNTVATAMGTASAAAARAARFQSTGAFTGLTSWVSHFGAGTSSGR